MTTFEEQFPNNSVARLDCPVCGHGATFTLSRDAVIRDLEVKDELETYKQKVKEAIEKCRVITHDDTFIDETFIDEIFKELKL